MDCLTAEPFVSILYDGEPVPADALAHITACLSCQTRLQDYAVISGRMHTLAAMERAGTPPLEAPPILVIDDRSGRIPGTRLSRSHTFLRLRSHCCFW
jgi:hypothetical protein